MKNKKPATVALLALLAVIPNISNAATAEPDPNISFSKELVASGKEITFNFGVPEEAVYASMYISCPSGVQVEYKGTDWCNQGYNLPEMPKSRKFKVINTTSLTKSISPNFYIYKDGNFSFSYGQAGSFSVGPKNQTTEIKTGAATSTLMIQIGKKSPKKTVKAGENKILAEFEFQSKKGNTIISGISVKDMFDILGTSVQSLEIYQDKKKISTVTRDYGDGQVDFEFTENALILKKDKKYTFIIKGDISKSLIGENVVLQVVGLSHTGPVTVEGIGTVGNVVKVK